VLAGVILLLAWLTGGGLGRALVVAVAFLFVSTAWSWWRFRQRIEQEAER
jgi:cytochrome bd-type quinol oxidase subunit 2